MEAQVMRSTWGGSGGTSTSSSSTAVARAPVLPAAFPPAVAEVEALLAEDIELGEKWKCLSRWCDAMLELVNEVMRGSSAEAPPLEEVWHWLAASERLMRSLAFAEHRAVAELLARASEEGGQEGREVAARWQTATRQLRQAQKESGWNAEYLRVVEEPLGRLSSDEVMRSGVLAKVVKTLLRSLHHIYCTSAYFKEHRMATLLHRVLKALVARAATCLAAPREAAAPPRGLGAAQRSADQLRDAFQAYGDHYFISEAAVGAASKSRPATATGAKGDRTIVSSATLRRKDTAELGLWRATVRHSLEHAEHCRAVSDRMASILSSCARLRAALLALGAAQPELQREAEGFLQLHGGLAGGLGAAELLDLRHRVAAGMELQGVEERLQELLARIEVAGVVVSEEAVLAVLDGPDGAEPRVVESADGGAEVLTLPGGAAAEEGGGAAGAPVGAEEMQRSIDSIQEELKSFEAQLQSLNEALAKKAPTPRGRLFFRPPSRSGASVVAPSRSGAEPSGSAPADDEDDADRAAALEVAKRSSWYREPPPLLAGDVPLIEVHQRIAQTTIHRCPSRPRTAQPRLFVTRPPEPEPCDAAASSGSGTATEVEVPAASASASSAGPPEREEEALAPPPAAAVAEEAAAAEEAAPEEAVGTMAVVELAGDVEVSLGTGGLEEDEEEDGEAFDPLESSGVSWQIA